MMNRNDRLLSRSLDNKICFWIVRTMCNDNDKDFSRDIGEIMITINKEILISETRVYFNRGNKICFVV